MRSQMFALIIGIDNYKSGSIWNLDSCVSDARRMSRWLTNDLGIPKSHTRLLLDETATLQNIEASLLEHLVNNKSIHKGDAILLYFAGHGSLVKAPDDWYDNKMPGRDVQVLCPFDHDTKAPSGRIAGLSEPSLTALLTELTCVKGDNITIIIDSCFSPPSNKRDRRHIRWTPTQKATAEDLRSCMWKGAGTSPVAESSGFYNTRITSHILLAACSANETAAEGKDGGKFTSAFLDAVRTVPLRRSSYNRLVENVVEQTGDDQRPICLGPTSRLVFGSTPFVPNAAFRSVSIHDEKLFRVEAGSIHGIEKGHELSIHSHNYSGQKNPPIASVVVREIHPTYCLVHRKSFSVTQPEPLPPDCWALAKPPSARSIHSMTWFQKLSAALRPFRAALRSPVQSV
ncbi:caspase domain-containing protein [Mucidula mucida]|nr:caspase domain-containing protein [Mucidula mucida]